LKNNQWKERYLMSYLNRMSYLFGRLVKDCRPATSVSPQGQLRLNLFDVRDMAKLSRADGEATVRAFCQSHYMGDKTTLCRCLGRYNMFLDTRDTGLVPHIVADGFWEYWNTQFMVATVKPGMTVMDVGANFGYFSLLMSDLVGPDGRVICVEPNPEIVACLRRSLCVNGFEARASISEVALGKNPSGSATFCIPLTAFMNGCVVSGAQSTQSGGRMLTVAATNIDTLTKDLKRLDFLKIDAEGAEADILEGMAGTIERFHPALFMEVNAGRKYDIRALHATLAKNYRSICYVDFDAQVKPLTVERLATENIGEDRMLYCT
jgi:FkbM family methyltransferase